MSYLKKVKSIKIILVRSMFNLPLVSKIYVGLRLLNASQGKMISCLCAYQLSYWKIIVRITCGVRILLSLSFSRTTFACSILLQSLSFHLGNQSRSTGQSLAYSMQVYELSVSLVFTSNHLLQWSMKGIKSYRIFIIVFNAGTKLIRIWLIDNDLSLFWHK